MNRRTLLGGLGVAGLASLSGCLGMLGMAEHESSPAGVDASVRSDTGYEQTGIDDVVVEEDVGVSAASETVVVTNYLTEHEKAVDMEPLGSQRGAVFMVLTTPQIGVAGRNFNPVEDMSAGELVDLVGDNYDEMGNISHEADDEITILGETTTRSRFSADAMFSGQEVEVDLHVSEAVEGGDDLLVTIGVYPQRLRSREEDNIIALMEAISLDIDANGDETGDNDDENDDANGGDEADDSDDSETDDSDGGTDDDSTEDDGGDGEEDDGDDEDDDGVLGILE
ncbi:hypothetical protein GS429_19385 [Natronorubrum sp. JWXQ-INN-674]|uniref:Uncharacterized protein n=1 Tax=Natronorubrum halalkaliphilum TaxID=2691917 RepID=A0A6B0VUE7_9EURY|nr:DUF6517 family protein [Natronorubrum halalkaliphilum]MXV64189.1 hypothetical protein [Natronorubrum halalkaliphilum]